MSCTTESKKFGFILVDDSDVPILDIYEPENNSVFINPTEIIFYGTVKDLSPYYYSILLNGEEVTEAGPINPGFPSGFRYRPSSNTLIAPGELEFQLIVRDRFNKETYSDVFHIIVQESPYFSFDEVTIDLQVSNLKITGNNELMLSSREEQDDCFLISLDEDYNQQIISLPSEVQINYMYIQDYIKTNDGSFIVSYGYLGDYESYLNEGYILWTENNEWHYHYIEEGCINSLVENSQGDIFGSLNKRIVRVNRDDGTLSDYYIHDRAINYLAVDNDGVLYFTDEQGIFAENYGNFTKTIPHGMRYIAFDHENNIYYHNLWDGLYGYNGRLYPSYSLTDFLIVDRVHYTLFVNKLVKSENNVFINYDSNNSNLPLYNYIYEIETYNNKIHVLYDRTLYIGSE